MLNDIRGARSFLAPLLCVTVASRRHCPSVRVRGGTMQVTISIVVSRRPGLLAQVVSVLMREECKLLRQAGSKADDPASQLFPIPLEGPEAAIHDLPRLLRTFGSIEPQGLGAQPAAAPQPAAGEAAVEDIVATFPDVAERVQALARSLPEGVRAATLSSLGERLGRREDQPGYALGSPLKLEPGPGPEGVRAATLSSLGERLGRREYQRGYALGSPLKLEQALRRMVLPAIRQLAKADLVGSALRLPGCPFCAARPANGRGCDFLVGFARGLLHAAPATADTAVHEAHGRAAGDPFCELLFAAP